MKKSLLGFLLLVSTSAFADQLCKPVSGHFEASVVFPYQAFPDGSLCTSTILCTAGRVWGGIQGTYKFTMTSMQPTTVATPSISFFTGDSNISLENGSTVLGTDTGSIDLGPLGGFASLITFSGATGQIRLRGELIGLTTSGDYVGTSCGQ